MQEIWDALASPWAERLTERPWSETPNSGNIRLSFTSDAQLNGSQRVPIMYTQYPWAVRFQSVTGSVPIDWCLSPLSSRPERINWAHQLSFRLFSCPKSKLYRVGTRNANTRMICCLIIIIILFLLRLSSMMLVSRDSEYVRIQRA